MKHWMKHVGLVIGVLALMGGTAKQAAAGLPSVAIVESDGGTDASGVVTALTATGMFSSVTDINTLGSTPTLAQLQQYSSVLVWTNFEPFDGTALGNVLGQYVNAGGGVVISTYSFSNPWAIGGTIATTGYSPLVNSGVNGQPTGNLVATQSDPIFNGINLSTLSGSFFVNSNYALPTLDAGATLLATDGNSVNMIARNANGNIIADNIFPGYYLSNVGNTQLYQLFANELVSVIPSTAVPEPSTFVVALAGCLSLGGYALRKRKLVNAA